MFGSGTTTLIILNEEMNAIMSLKEIGLLIKDVSGVIKSKSK